MVAALACRNLSKTYGRGLLAERALVDITLAFRSAETCVMLGPSGSGKTTLLSIMGCLLSPSRGDVEIDGKVIDFSSPARLARLRRQALGFVFQHAQLLPFLSVRENLNIVLRNSGAPLRQSRERLPLLLERLGIAKYEHRKPGELSGGQRQRVAIARAVLHRPRIILADEPTAALDWENGQAAMRMLVEQAKADDSLLVAVTHDTRLLDMFDRVIRLESGSLQET